MFLNIRGPGLKIIHTPAIEVTCTKVMKKGKNTIL